MLMLKRVMASLAMVTATLAFTIVDTAPARAAETKKAPISATDGVFLQEAHSDVLFEVLVEGLARKKGSANVRRVAQSLADKGRTFDAEHISPTADAVGTVLKRRGEGTLANMTRLSPYQAILYHDLLTRKGEDFNAAALHALLFVNQVWMGQAMAIRRFGRVVQVRDVAEVACGIAKSNIDELHQQIPPVSPTEKW